MVVYKAGEVSLAEGGGAARREMQCHIGKSEDVRSFCLLMLGGGVCSSMDGQRRPSGISLRLACVCEHFFWCLLLQDVVETIIKVTREMLMKWANWLPETAMAGNMMQIPVWVVSVPFCAMRHMNNGRYVPEHETAEGERLRMERNKIVDFY